MALSAASFESSKRERPLHADGLLRQLLAWLPRATQDIDLVIAPNPATFETLINSFPEDHDYVSQVAALDAYQRSSLFSVIDFASGCKIDFILRKPRELSQVEFERRAPAHVFNSVVYVASPEDVMISKLEWAKLADSERQIEDVTGIFRTQGKDLDRAYVDRWVKTLGLENQWTIAKAKVENL